MNSQEIRKVVLHWLSERRKNLTAFEKGAPLSTLQLDSLEALHFISFLQTTFSVPVTPEEFLDGKSFQSLDSITAYLERKISLS